MPRPVQFVRMRLLLCVLTLSALTGIVDRAQKTGSSRDQEMWILRAKAQPGDHAVPLDHKIRREWATGFSC